MDNRGFYDWITALSDESIDYPPIESYTFIQDDRGKLCIPNWDEIDRFIADQREP